MSWAINAVFESAISKLDHERRRLESIDTEGARVRFDIDGFVSTNRALSYVIMGGVLEEMMRDLPDALAKDIRSLQPQRRSLPVSLLAAIELEEFRRCRDESVNSIIARTGILSHALSHSNDQRVVDDFGDFLKLADGQTIGEKNFQALWLLLSLPGDWRNEPNDTFLLKEIKGKRNDVAHMSGDPVEIGRSKPPSELKSMTIRLTSLIEHCQLTIWDWLDQLNVSKVSNST